MSSRTFSEPKKENSTSFSPILGKKPDQTSKPESPNGGQDMMDPGLGHNFSNIRVTNGESFKQFCPLGLSSPTYCPFGGACDTCPARIQTKPVIGQPGDKYELEADRVAEQVMRMPEPSIQGEVVPEGEEELRTIWTKAIPSQITHTIQRQVELEKEDEEEEEEEKNIIQAKQGSGGSPEVTLGLPAYIQSLQRGGQPLPESTWAFLEPRLGYDFSQVRVHTGTDASDAARAVNARAFAVGRDVIFGEGQYKPSAREGQRLLAHELTHFVQQDGGKANPPYGKPKQCVQIQRKLSLHSPKEAKAFKWFLTPNDATNFQYAGKLGKPLPVSVTKKRTAKIDDPFRFSILKRIIDHSSETLLIRESELDVDTPSHEIYENGKLARSGIRTTLRMMAWPLGAGGVTVPSRNLALAVDPKYSGPVTGIANQSWILYSSPSSLAHEFGHAFLLFSGTSWTHGTTIPKSAGIIGPSGKTFAGKTDVFISKFVEEKFAELTLLDPGALHFSPTVIRKWPEPPDFKLTFTGTWLEFKAKYPGAKVSQEVKGKGRSKRRSLKVCVPKKGEICPWAF